MLNEEQIKNNVQKLIKNFTRDSSDRRIKEGYYEQRLRQIFYLLN